MSSRFRSCRLKQSSHSERSPPPKHKSYRLLFVFLNTLASALFGMERSIALSSYFSKKGEQSPKLKVGPIALLVTSVFAGKCDRPSSIPDTQPAIALLELVKKCDRSLYYSTFSNSSICNVYCNATCNLDT